MSNFSMFRLSDGTATLLPHQALPLERKLQTLVETQLLEPMGIAFLRTEWSIASGRMDTVGLDENNLPVIIEYKRDKSDGALIQGLFYLDWLLNHKGDFLWLVRDKLGEERAKAVDWSAPRLLIIAETFNLYDLHAVKQIGRNIELYQYHHYTEGLIALEQINEAQGTSLGSKKISSKPSPLTPTTTLAPTTTQAPTTTLAPLEEESSPAPVTIEHELHKALPQTQQLFEELRQYLRTVDADVQLRFLKPYFAFYKLKNFLTGSPYKGKPGMLVWLHLNPDSVNFSQYPGVELRDMRGIGHDGTGDLQIYLSSTDDLQAVLSLIDRAYSESP